MGRIVAAHGVRGGIKVEPESEVPDALLAHETWQIRPARAATWREIRMTSARMHSGAVLAELAGVATRDEALALRGAEVGVPRSALPRPTPIVAVAHSPTPSIVRIAASSNGDGKNALAACDS